MKFRFQNLQGSMEHTVAIDGGTAPERFQVDPVSLFRKL
jgi:hypothetical protein